MTEHRKGLWYLAHPYTADTADEISRNVVSADTIAARLIDKGYQIYSPISHTHQMHLIGVQLGLWKVSEWKMWMDIDFEFIKHCEGIIMSPYWSRSKGCRIELETFEDNGKKILYAEDLLEDIKKEIGWVT